MTEVTLSAQRLLSEYDEAYGLGDAPPIPVEEIAESHLLLNIIERDDLRTVSGAPTDGGVLSGLLTTADRTIWIDVREARRSPERRRFTIAHEVAHWILHAKKGEIAGFQRFCRPVDIKVGEDHSEEIEREANRFAAELLMPGKILNSRAEKCGFNLPLLASEFEVSVPALELRLTMLGSMPAWMRSRS
jgi:hypothetical protein